MKTISLVNTQQCPCPGTHFKACMEFIEGFKDYGFEFSESKTLEDCKDKTILLLSCHKVNLYFLNKLNQISPDSIYILWYYHNYVQYIPFKKWILTGEHFYETPVLDFHKKADLYNQSIPNFVPLLFRANENPSLVGEYKKNIQLNGCFMGTPYKKNWITGLENILYYDIKLNKMLDYDTRKDIYLKSKVCFGFHHDDNILNHHVTQRVFEGMCYGCVVISDNPAASKMTNGIVEYVATKEDFIKKYFEIINNMDLYREKIEQGYEWVKKYGTNRYSALLFLEKIKSLWNISL